MSSGGSHEEPAPVGAVVRALQANAGLRAHVLANAFVSRRYRVPYLAGSSIDGGTVYIDANTPEVVGGVEVDGFYANHEMFEWWLMVMRGLDYYRAHRLAHGFERMRMMMAGISDEAIAEYERASEAMVSVDEHLKLPPEAFPPDLYLGPYESDKDALDQRLLPVLRAARRERLSKEEVGYTDDGGEDHCSVCSHFLAPGSCEIVEGTISPGGWCRRFEAKARAAA